MIVIVIASIKYTIRGREIFARYRTHIRDNHQQMEEPTKGKSDAQARFFKQRQRTVLTARVMQ